MSDFSFRQELALSLVRAGVLAEAIGRSVAEIERGLQEVAEAQAIARIEAARVAKEEELERIQSRVATFEYRLHNSFQTGDPEQALIQEIAKAVHGAHKHLDERRTREAVESSLRLFFRGLR